MKSSPYYPAFSTDLDMWEKTLALISEIIDLQLNVQRQWMYLESIVRGESCREGGGSAALTSLPPV